MGDNALVRVLFTLSCAKYKNLNREPNTKILSPTDSFELNPTFSDRTRRIKERKKVVEDVSHERRYDVDASIVRIMKSRKILSHQQLIIECVEQLRDMFKPDPKVVKKRIQGLVNRDYLERDQDNLSMYQYIV